MSKGETLYVKGMNLSESEDEEEEVDVWDDKKLNEAYDKALAIANAEVAKRIAMSTNNRSQKAAPIQESKSKKKNSTSKTDPSKTNKKEHVSSTFWKQGMPCRAIFEEDGEEYEAFLLRFVNEKECQIRFVGYENSEIVRIDELKPSLGNTERTKQIYEAKSTNPDNSAHTTQDELKLDRMECDSDKAGSVASAVTDKSHHKKKKSSKKKHHQKKAHFDLPDLPFAMPNMTNFMGLSSLDMLPPPPVPPALAHTKDTEEQAVHSMLLSWYMSGYYTGLYQGMKRTKTSSHSHH